MQQNHARFYMADNSYDSTDPISLNILGVSDLVESKVNRVSRAGGSAEEGPKGQQINDLDLPMDDDELLLLSVEWVSQYTGYEGKLRPKQENNARYYIGDQNATASPYVNDGIPIASNYIFPAVETFLAAALAKNPDPVVWSDATPEGQLLSDKTSTMLEFHANQLSLRPKLAQAVRQWSMNYLGVLKHGWDKYEVNGEEVGDIKLELRPIKNFVFDTKGYVDVDGDFISYLGERIRLTAREMIEQFPKHKAYITLQVDGKLGTECVYTEWWTDEFTFCTYMNIVLEKHKNQFFNYDGKRNHFSKPKKPYTFMAVFTLGTQPHDITGLIEQNIPNQNLITKEVHQLDYNISRNNNSTAFSENNFNQQTAKQATQAWIKGHNVLVPPGVPINEAIVNFPITPIPDSMFTFIANNIQALQHSFGTEGLSAQPQNEETTARGMILNQQRDNSRIGGAINERIEQCAKNIFNWWVQEYHVFYDVKHFAAILGTLQAVEYNELSSSDYDRQVMVTVAPDSLKPKDELTAMNQAQALWDAGALGLKTFLKLQKVSDVQEATEDALVWKLGVAQYIQMNFPELAQQLQQGGQSAQGGAPQGAQPPVQGEPVNTGGEPPNAALNQVSLPK